MPFPQPHFIETNGLRMAVYEQGDKAAMSVVMCHGFPEIGYSWRHQLPAVASAGFRAIAPDQRGYGFTDGPIDVPCLMISAANNFVLRPEFAEGMEQYYPDLEKHIIPDCGHWTQSEKPAELNALMVDWLKRRFG